MISEPVLANPDYSKPFIIQTDASDLGMGGVLVQGEGANERVIAYASSKFSAAQKNYMTTERECLAVITAIEKFRPYIDGVKFTVVTDHASLLWLKNIKDPTGRLCRWSLRLQAFDFEFVHRKGKNMVVADALSRAIDVIDISSFPNSEDTWYKTLVQRVKRQPAQFAQFRIENGVLYKNCPIKQRRLGYVSEWRVVVPSAKRTDVIKHCHDPPLSAHGGYYKTVDRVRREFFWPHMDKDVRTYVQNCEICKSIKPSNKTQTSPMGTFRKPVRPWHMLYVDFIGPLPRSKQGFCYVFTVIDSFSKFVHAEPMRVATSNSAIAFLEKRIFLVFGVPEMLISDNCSQFVSNDFRNFLERYSVKFWPVARYHPQANASESANKTVETSIRAYIKEDTNHREWDKHIHEISCAMNSAVHSSSKLSPYFVNFGQHIITSGKTYSTQIDDDSVETRTEENFKRIRETVTKNLIKNYEQSKKRYDLRSRPISYKKGDIVWKNNLTQSNASKAVIAKFFGKVKCKVKRKIGTNSYELEDMNGKNVGVYNTDQLKS